MADDIDQPSLSADGLELSYAWQGRIERRTRQNLSQTFSSPAELVIENGTDPDLSFDGTRLLYSNALGLAELERGCN